MQESIKFLNSIVESVSVTDLSLLKSEIKISKTLEMFDSFINSEINSNNNFLNSFVQLESNIMANERICSSNISLYLFFYFFTHIRY